MMVDNDLYNKLTRTNDKEWLKSMLKNRIGYYVNKAALRLFELGEETLAIETLLKRMKIKKVTGLSEGAKAETEFDKSIQERYKWAVTHLFEALSIYEDDASNALAMIASEEIKERLVKLSETESESKRGAEFALAIIRQMEFKEYLHQLATSSDIEWLKSRLKEDRVPIHARMIAKSLYRAGEEKLGLEILINQMNLYKKPDTPPVTKTQTCSAAVRDLGYLEDERAIPHLIEAMDIYTIDAACGLSYIRGENLKKQLRELAKDDNQTGFGANLALGMMGELETLTFIMDVVRNIEIYEKKYKTQRHQYKTPWTFKDILCILNNYDTLESNRLFLESITTWDIESFIRGYASNEYNDNDPVPPVKSVFSNWHITKKYGWDKYVTPDKYIVLLGHYRPKWEKEEKKLVEKIWKDVRKRLEKEDQ